MNSFFTLKHIKWKSKQAVVISNFFIYSFKLVPTNKYFALLWFKLHTRFTSRTIIIDRRLIRPLSCWVRHWGGKCKNEEVFSNPLNHIAARLSCSRKLFVQHWDFSLSYASTYHKNKVIFLFYLNSLIVSFRIQ